MKTVKIEIRTQGKLLLSIQSLLKASQDKRVAVELSEHEDGDYYIVSCLYSGTPEEYKELKNFWHEFREFSDRPELGFFEMDIDCEE